MPNLRTRSKRHVSVSAHVIRTRELPPAEQGYDVKSKKDLEAFHATKGKMPMKAELDDLLARAKAHMREMNVYLPLSADGLVNQRIGARRGI